MGRKSNTKKIIRQYIIDKNDEALPKKIKNDKTVKKQLKKEIRDKNIRTTKKTKSKAKLKIVRSKMLKSGFVLIMVTMIFAVGVLIFQRAYRPESIAKYLPVENTVMTLEINSNLNHSQVKKALNLLKNHPEASQQNLIKEVEKFFNFSFEKDVSSWIGRQVGLAVLDFGNTQETGISTVYFAEILTKRIDDNFLKDAKKIEYKKHQLYSFEDDKIATVIGNYLFISKDKNALQKLIELTGSSNTRLSKDSGYIKIHDNLPVNKIAMLFINYKKITPDIIKKSAVLQKIELIKPITDLFKSEGLALIALDDKFAMQSFLNIDNKGEKNQSYLAFKEKFEANLLDVISKDALAVWGGKNLDYQLKRMIGAFSGGEKSSMEVFDNVLQNYTQKYFGTQTNLRKDILPMFNNEYTLALENIEGKNVYKLIIELSDKDKDREHVNTVAESFANAGAIYKEKIVDHKLPDGTNSREVVAVSEEILTEEFEIEKTKVYALKVKGNTKGIFYAFIGNRAVISDDISGIKSSIDLFSDKSQSLALSQSYTKLIQPLLNNSDELTYFNINNLMPVLFGNTPVSKWIRVVQSIASGKNYFSNGITTTNYIHIE